MGFLGFVQLGFCGVVGFFYFVGIGLDFFFVFFEVCIVMVVELIWLGKVVVFIFELFVIFCF